MSFPPSIKSTSSANAIVEGRDATTTVVTFRDAACKRSTTTASVTVSNAEVVSSRKVTTVVVASRPSTIALADDVLFIEGGKLTDHGPHSALMLSNEGYRNLMQSFEHDRNEGNL